MGKKIIVWCAIILLAGLYVFSIIAAILARPEATGLFMTSIFCTVFIPILVWALIYFYEKVHPKKDDTQKDVEQNKAE